MRIVYRNLALHDLEQISAYLNQRSPAGARNVLQAIHAAIRAAAENPESARRTSDSTVRVKMVSGYDYKVFYSAGPDAIEILHVRHGARQPWFPERR